MKVLVVGIVGERSAIVAKSFGVRGHEQLSVESGLGGLALLRDAALVVVEEPLEDMTAADFCRRARAEGSEAVILVITSREEELPNVLEAGATDVYTTSFGTAALELRLLIAERLVGQHAELRNRELRFRRLFESGVAGVTISDFDGNFKEANAAFLRMLGYTREDMLAGKLNWEVITPLDRLVPDMEARAQLRATGFLPLREREYLHKDGRHIAALVGSAALEGTSECISYVADISARKQSEDALRASEEQYRMLFERSPFPKFLCDPETLAFLAVNDTAIDHYGYSRGEFLSMTLDRIRPAMEVVGEATISGTSRSRLEKHTTKDGSVIDVEVTLHRFVLGNRPCDLAVALDVTKRNRTEAQLRQAQKMEAIGSLTGGIAHDFNNLLSIIVGYSEMLVTDLRPADPMREDAEQIHAAGKRAAGLTRQLLAFSRQQILQPRILDLNAVVDSVTKMLRRLIGEDVELVVVGDADLATVKADPGQIEQVLMNLAVNSRDAMPNGGTLTIETANVRLESASAATHGEVKPGAYVMLAVADTGSGMDVATRDRIFEPYFTTKPLGKGTGLGLSTVFGIVQQSGGNLSVRSEPGVGTSIKIYLPQSDLGLSGAAETSDDPRRHRGSETILVVEDEEGVRGLVRAILERYGYHVLAAQSGGDALLICEEHHATIHVLLTDVVMPRMSGRHLAERLRPLRPEMKVLYMSGYTDDSVLRHGVSGFDFEFLQKPITAEALTRKLREVIESR